MGYHQILVNEDFMQHIEKLEILEKNRVFCKHGLSHLLDVCRIAYIRVLEEGLEIPKDLVYGAGLLHDIGRVEEYERGISHHKASVQVAEKILRDSGYEEREIAEICRAIDSHRKKVEETGLAGILYFADKASRCCFDCQAFAQCKWPEERKNKGIWA